jgi:hypothetical protein
VTAIGNNHRVADTASALLTVARCLLPLILTSLLAGPAASQEKLSVDLLLVLAVDCSDSVMQSEYRLQTVGISEAFRTPELVEAIEAGPARRIAVALVQWSGKSAQRLAVPWRIVDGPLSAMAFAREVENAGRQEIAGETSLSGAIDFSASLFASGPFRSARHVIDVSGDGQNSDGPSPEAARDRATAQGIVINGLAILSDDPGLDTYYEGFVAGGPASFVMAARDFDDYRDAIRQKLIREILSPSS